MKNTKLIIAAGMFLGIFATDARAEELTEERAERGRVIAPYISGRIGVGSLNVEGGDSVLGFENYGVAVGARWQGAYLALRGEGEFGISNFSDTYSTGGFPTSIESELEQNFQTYMANFYVDFFTNYRIKPYLGAGIGMIRVDETRSLSTHNLVTGVTTPGATYDFSGNGMVYGLYGGFGFNITRGLSADVGARYQTATIEGTGLDIITLNTGLRYTF